jgi:hypothetical protein
MTENMYRLADDTIDKDPSLLNFNFTIYYANQLKKDKSLEFFRNRIPKQIRKYAKRCKRATSNFISSLYTEEQNANRFHMYGSTTLLNNLEDGLRFFKPKSCLCDAVLVSECKFKNEIIVNGFCTFQILTKKKRKREIKLTLMGVDKKFGNVIEEMINFFKESLMFDATHIQENEDSDSDSDDDEDDDDDDGNDSDSSSDEEQEQEEKDLDDDEEQLSEEFDDPKESLNIDESAAPPDLDFEDLTPNNDLSLSKSTEPPSDTPISDTTVSDNKSLKGGTKQLQIHSVVFHAKFNKILDGILSAAHFSSKETEGENIRYKWKLRQMQDDMDEFQIVRGKKHQYKFIYEIDEEEMVEDDDENSEDKIHIIGYVTIDNKFVQLTKAQIEQGYYLKAAKQNEDTSSSSFSDDDVDSSFLDTSEIKTLSKNNSLNESSFLNDDIASSDSDKSLSDNSMSNTILSDNTLSDQQNTSLPDTELANTELANTDSTKTDSTKTESTSTKTDSSKDLSSTGKMGGYTKKHKTNKQLIQTRKRLSNLLFKNGHS